MTCDNARMLLQSGPDGALSLPERTALNVHLELCAACRAERETQRRLARLTDQWAARAMELSDPGDAFTAQVLSRLDQDSRLDHPEASRLRVGLPLAASLLGLGLLPLVPGGDSAWAGLPMPFLSALHDLPALPGWLGASLTALPDAARAAFDPPQAAFVPAWTTAGLFGAFLLNAGFCVHARQRSAS